MPTFKLKKSDRKYLRLGSYATKCPDYLLRRVLFHINRPKDMTRRDVRTILKVIREEFNPKKHRLYITHNFRESRFIGTNTILKKRQATCGSLATVVASVFRTLDVPTKLVNGFYRRRNPNMRHAWNEIYVEGERRFIPFDITRKSYRLGKFHRRKDVWVDWSDLKRTYKSRGN